MHTEGLWLWMWLTIQSTTTRISLIHTCLVQILVVVVDGGVIFCIAIYHWFRSWAHEQINEIIIFVGFGLLC